MSILALLLNDSTPLGEVRKASILSQPYNAPRMTWLDLPAHPGYSSGYGTHPDVLDMQALTGAPWNGYRYWMAWTPYVGGNDETENPCIAASHDRINWATPPGLNNPLWPWEGTSNGQKRWNSDTDLIFDPATGRMWCFWRSNFDFIERLNGRWSVDGVNWSERIDIIAPESVAGMSPAVVRAGNLWRMWQIDPGSYEISVRSAASIEGPWSSASVVSTTGLGAEAPWHLDVVYEYGQYRMLLNTKSRKLVAGVSEDGLNFRFGAPFLSAVWEAGIYRATMVDAGNNADWHLWYGIIGQGWRVCYTQVPKSHWWEL